MLVVEPHHQRSQAVNLPICNSLLRRLLGYLWLRIYHNEELYAEIHAMNRGMTRGRYHHVALPSKVATENRLRNSSQIKETGKSPCSTSFEEFVGFKMEEAIWPKTEVLDSGEER
ncbi:hypothetical protein RB195_024356 [Necator americanus]|uniref:Uncharacterized protein n=1 Tax=Necator americanus TaxID=51031 RepID=A0ABR1EQ61_NECAM